MTVINAPQQLRKEGDARELINSSIDPLGYLEPALSRVNVYDTLQKLVRLLDKAYTPGIVLRELLETSQHAREGSKGN